MATALFGTLMEQHTPFGTTPLHEIQKQELELRHRRAFGMWLMHYSSLHRILLVGEGDFSFSSALATKFGCADNIVSTSLDSREKVLRLYKSARLTIANLEERGAWVLHGVDATRLDQLVDFRGRLFDRIVFNFPHAGFWGKEDDPEVIKKHRDLMSMFFRSASMLLAKHGEIHVTHKEGEPYNRWKLEEEALKCGLFLTQCDDFRIRDYPGYTNKRGDGSRIDESFLLGECKTYMFMLTAGAFFEKELLLVRRDSLFSPLKRRYESGGEEEEEEYRYVKRQRMELGTYSNIHMPMPMPTVHYNVPVNLQRDIHMPMPMPTEHYNVPVNLQRATSFNELRVHHACDPAMLREPMRKKRRINRERRMLGITLPNLNLSWLPF